LVGRPLARRRYHEDGVPTTVEGLTELAQLANATGAACCQVLGALPDDQGRCVRACADQILLYLTV
jgi:hypothetical protein